MCWLEAESPEEYADEELATNFDILCG